MHLLYAAAAAIASERIQMGAEMQPFLFYGIQKPINRRTRHKPQTPQLILVFLIENLRSEERHWVINFQRWQYWLQLTEQWTTTFHLGIELLAVWISDSV